MKKRLHLGVLGAYIFGAIVAKYAHTQEGVSPGLAPSERQTLNNGYSQRIMEAANGKAGYRPGILRRDVCSGLKETSYKYAQCYEMYNPAFENIWYAATCAQQLKLRENANWAIQEDISDLREANETSMRGEIRLLERARVAQERWFQDESKNECGQLGERGERLSDLEVRVRQLEQLLENHMKSHP